MAKLLIQVCGDPTVDWLSVRNEEYVAGGRTYYWPPHRPRPDVRLSSQPGGSALIMELLQAMVPSEVAEVGGVKLRPTLLQKPKDNGIVRAWTVWQAYVEEGRQPAFRLAEWRECEPGEWNYAGNTLTGSPDLLVVEDSGLGFRDHEKGWPQVLRDSSLTSSPQHIILKLAQYGAMTQQQSEDQQQEQAPDRQSNPLLERIAELGLARQTTVVTSINDLRSCPVRVGTSLSWEGIFEDVVTAVRSQWPFWHADDEQLVFHQVIVTVEASGAIVVGQDGDALIFDRRGQEGDFSDRLSGEMVGYNTCVVGALATAWADSPDEVDWRQATRDGIGLARLLHIRGYEVALRGENKLGHLRFPHAILAEGYRKKPPPRRENAGQAQPITTDAEQDEDMNEAWDLDMFVDKRDMETKQEEGDKWSILKQTVVEAGGPACDTPRSQAGDQVCDYARGIALCGPETAISNVPVAVVGHWRSADRKEIEGVRSVINALKDYLATEKRQAPLSIAVFGPPGSGKSFVIKQIAEGLGLEADAQLSFNLSQFESSEELPSALQQAQDLQLSGKMPLVFWDEFDSPCRGQKLGWLPFFLAPMQDGQFYDRGRLHPTGRAIYVFAGATSHLFEDFCLGESEADRAAKKPDFISRLRAYIDVRGVNADPSSVEDELYPIRRAFLLNTFLERYAPQLKKDGEFVLENGVLDAFLKTTRYRHGARSMEAIITMSSLARKKKFELSSLPPENVLRMHVDTREFTAFTRLGYRDTLRVGITGHIGLDPDRMDVLTAGVRKAIEFIEGYYPERYLTVFSPLAVGADRLVARELLRREATRLVAVLPVPRDDYVNDFGATDAHHCDYDGAELRQEFRHWISERAVEVIEMTPAATRDESYFNAGCFIAEYCDVMIAIWDGSESQGLGGTADIVKKAEQLNKPICHVWAGNFKDDPANRTDVGDKHGTVEYINFLEREPHKSRE